MISTRRLAGLVACALVALTTARAQLSIQSTVAPSGGMFHYNYKVSNFTDQDVAIVTLSGLFSSNLTVQNLTAPSGFVTSFDTNLGLLSFIEDTQTFSAGGVFGFFQFDSPFAPGTGSYSALDITGTSLDGITIVPVAATSSAVPEPSTYALFGAVALTGLVFKRRYLSAKS